MILQEFLCIFLELLFNIEMSKNRLAKKYNLFIHNSRFEHLYSCFFFFFLFYFLKNVYFGGLILVWIIKLLAAIFGKTKFYKKFLSGLMQFSLPSLISP